MTTNMINVNISRYGDLNDRLCAVHILNAFAYHQCCAVSRSNHSGHLPTQKSFVVRM